jgi:hypothetical protein
MRVSSGPAELGAMEARETSVRPRPEGGARLTSLLRGGTEGNERLTAMTAVVLLVLLAVEGVTLLAIRPLLSLHVFFGLLLIPPVALKLGATGYRFARYYLRDQEYVRKGPPAALMRMLVAPGLVAATVGIFVTGVALLAIGPGGGVVLGLHKASFVVWSAAFAIHVLAYVLRIPGLVASDWGSGRRTSGASLRVGVLAAALVLGLIVAVAALPAAGPWLHWSGADH